MAKRKQTNGKSKGTVTKKFLFSLVSAAGGLAVVVFVFTGLPTKTTI